MNDQHEIDLGRKLEERLARFLADACHQVIPPGTLGAGMGVSQDTEVQHVYDPSTKILTIEGVVRIRVNRAREDR